MNSMLIDHPKTIITPHTAFNTIEAIHRIIDISLDNIAAFYRGTPQNAIS